MKAQVGLDGNFSFEVHKPDGKVEFYGPNKNFITSTGLCMPNYFAFADCFRYVSLGSGTGFNTLLGNTIAGKTWGTTGLISGLSQFSYIGSRTSNSDPTTTQYVSAGYIEQGSGVTLYRSWKVPAGNNNFFNTPYTFGEFMVSPGQPRDVNGNCSYSFTGPEQSDLENGYENYMYNYMSFCDAPLAFSRITGQISVAQGDFLIVNYILNVGYITGVQNISLTCGAGGPPVGGSNWIGQVSGSGCLIHHGIKLINPISNPVSSSIGSEGQANYQPAPTLQNEVGESFIPAWGCPIEPNFLHKNLGNDSQGNPLNNYYPFVGYISSDNLQFIINSYTGGGISSGPVSSNGVMGWRPTPSTDAAIGNHTTPGTLAIYGIRQDGTQLNYPDPTNYNNQATDFPLQLSQPVDYYIGLVNKDIMIETDPTHISSFNPAVRSRNSSLSFQYQGYTQPSDLRFIRAISIGYLDPINFKTYNPITNPNLVYNGAMPIYDVVFASTNGEGVTHVQQSNQTYDITNENNYFSLDANGLLVFTFNINWSAPCPQGVVGC